MCLITASTAYQSRDRDKHVTRRIKNLQFVLIQLPREPPNMSRRNFVVI